MKQMIRKSVAGIAMLSVMISIVASCGKAETDVASIDGISSSEETSVDVLSEDTVWYNSHVVNINSASEGSDNTFRTLLGGTGDKIVFNALGASESIELYDLQGNMVSGYDIQDAYMDLDEYVYATDPVMIDGKVYFKIESFSNYDNRMVRLGSLDIETGSLGEAKTVSNNMFVDEMYAMSAWHTDYPVLSVGGYMVDAYLPEQGIIFVLTDTEGNSTKIDMSSTMADEIIDISGIVDTGDGRAIVCAEAYSGRVYIDLDISNMTAQVSSSDYGWLERHNPINVEGLGSVVVNNNAIYQVDVNTGSLNEIFSFAQSNINRAVLSNLVPVFVTDDHVVIAGEAMVPGLNMVGTVREPVIVVLDKAETNPNVGKSLIRIASIDGRYNYGLCEAVSRFNESNENYFITFDSRYDLSNYEEPQYSDTGYEEDEYAKDAARADLCAQLTIDLISGNGPDIIINGNAVTQLNNSDYLIDLTDYVQNNMNETDFFRGFIDSSADNGAIYQLPLSFAVSGISADANAVSEGQAGFDYPSYASFVSGPCNGLDPLARYGQLSFCVDSLDYMSDLMTTPENDLNFDNAAFRALAEYTKNNIVPSGENVEYGLHNTAVYIYNIWTYVEHTYGGARILGRPTYDGRGPAAVTETCVGISAQSSNVDGCMQFLSYLTGEECQSLLGRTEFPINKAAFRSTSMEMIDYLNSEINIALADPTMNSLPSEFPLVTIDNSVVDQMITMFDGLYLLKPVDPAVKIIVREEIQAYLAGQKSLDEIIGIINDRAHTVVSERG